MNEHVKVRGVIPRIQYVADGLLATYEFPFAIFDASDIRVYLDDIQQNQNSYTVTGVRHSDGGSVIFNTAPNQGVVITIVRDLSIERTTDFQEGGALRADTLNDELDYQIACTQQIAENLNRSMVLPPYATDNDLDLTLPVPSAGKAIVWNSDGTNFENSTVAVNDLESTLNGYKTAAESAASTATTKAEIASDKADIATTKAQLASDKADIATAKAAEAVATLSNKASTDMDNLTTIGKTLITGLGLPDYTTQVTYAGNTWTQAPYDCYVTGGVQSGSNISLRIDINLNATEIGTISIAYSSGHSCVMGIFVPKGYYFRTVTPQGISTQDTAYYKLKGA